MSFICGFYAVNQDHCWINGHCVVCRVNLKEGQYYENTLEVFE